MSLLLLCLDRKEDRKERLKTWTTGNEKLGFAVSALPNTCYLSHALAKGH